MDSGFEIDPSAEQTSVAGFQQKEKYNVIKNILESHGDYEEIDAAEEARSFENKRFQTSIIETERESKDVQNVTSSPKTKQNLFKKDFVEHSSEEFNQEYEELCNSELSKSQNISENINNVYALPSNYRPLASPNYKEDEEAYFECNEVGKFIGESDQSSSSSSLSSCDASFSHSEDENDDLNKKCSIQSAPNSGFTYNYNDLIKNASTKPIIETKLASEINLMNENIKETRFSPMQNSTKSANEVFLQKNAEMDRQLPDTKEHPYSRNGPEVARNYNITSTIQKPCHVMRTNTAKDYTSQEIVVSCESPEEIALVKPEEIALVKPVEKTTSVRATYNRSHSVTTNKPAKAFRNYDIDGGRKSTENVEFVKPDAETAAKIMNRVEFYFTDFNILKNNFLLKHTRKNKEGYISLKLVTSFRKVKNITKDWRVVAYSMENSKVLKLNPEKTKICRIVPIPKIEDTSFGKTVIVFNLPFQNPFSEQLEELFGKFGNVANAEIMTTRSKNYNLYHKKCLFFNRDVASATFGVVEFENYKDVQTALKDEENYLPKENEMIVVPLVAKYYKYKPKAPFRYKSTISYPKNACGRYYSKSEYPQDIYAVNDPNYARQYGKYYYYSQQVPRSNFAYGANGGYYSNYSDQCNFHGKQKMSSNNYSTSKYAPRYSDGNGKYSDHRRQNRHLKTNNSINIDKRFASANRKNEVS